MLGVAVFVLSYPLLLALWIQAKPFYGLAVTEVGARLAAAAMGVRVEQVRLAEQFTSVTFACPILLQGAIQEMLIDLKLAASTYSFNVPLTVALVLALLAPLGWDLRALAEALVIVIIVHLLYVSSFCALQIFRQLVTSGIKAPSNTIQFALEFLWNFTDNMIIRFEPFLVAVYLWLRRPPARRLTQ